MKILQTKHFTETVAVQKDKSFLNKVIRALEEISTQTPIELLMSHKTSKLVSRDQDIYSYRIDNRLRLLFSIYENESGEPTLILLSIASHP